MIAVIHDILITAGVYSLVGREVTSGTVAAFLTILGYSLYDTIIVFDRIRENVPRLPRATFSQIANRSLCEVLTRSLITGLSTVFLIGVILIFGGDTLRDFAFAMMVGVLSGTYSSIFIASPVLIAWKEREPAYQSRAARIREQMGHGPGLPRGQRGGAGRRRARARQRRSEAGGNGSPVEPEAAAAGDAAAEPRRLRRRQRRRAGGARPGRGGRDDRARASARRAAPAPGSTSASTEGTGEGLAMALLVWFTLGVALWHFTVFVPDHFVGGIIGAFLAAIAGAVVSGAPGSSSPETPSARPTSSPSSPRFRAA